jgi:hypothetical protein
MLNDAEFYRLSVRDRKAWLRRISPTFRALPDSEQDVAIQTLESSRRQRVSTPARDPVLDLVSNPIFYTLGPAQCKQQLARASENYRALPDTEKDTVIETLNRCWRERGRPMDAQELSELQARWSSSLRRLESALSALRPGSASSGHSQVPATSPSPSVDEISLYNHEAIWAPEVDLTRLVVLWVVVTVLTGAAIVVLQKQA